MNAHTHQTICGYCYLTNDFISIRWIDAGMEWSGIVSVSISETNAMLQVELDAIVVKINEMECTQWTSSWSGESACDGKIWKLLV